MTYFKQWRNFCQLEIRLQKESFEVSKKRGGGRGQGNFDNVQTDTVFFFFSWLPIASNLLLPIGSLKGHFCQFGSLLGVYFFFFSKMPLVLFFF